MKTRTGKEDVANPKYSNNRKENEMSQDRDYIVRATAAEGSIRAFAITLRHLVEEARVDHDTSPVITAALGRLLSGAAMMGTMMKGRRIF